jgi:hypothetical protein
VEFHIGLMRVNLLLQALLMKTLTEQEWKKCQVLHILTYLFRNE